MLALPLFAVLALQPPLPDALELCILKAEVCALEASINGPKCGEPGKTQWCISTYEECSYDIPEAHDPHCRLTFVWCKLEEIWLPAAELAKCQDVYLTCPSNPL